MPNFDTISVDEALMKTASGKRAEIIKEYAGYIEQLSSGQAGRLRAGAGETAAAVRRRLGAAARLTGKQLTIKRAGDEVIFWSKARGTGAPRGRGRPRKNAA